MTALLIRRHAVDEGWTVPRRQIVSGAPVSDHFHTNPAPAAAYGG